MINMKKLIKMENIHSILNGKNTGKYKQKGFSLVEVTIAMVICLVVMLGLVTVFTFAVSYNAGNNSRSQALAIMQEHVELARSAKFTRNKTDDGSSRFDLTGGTKTPFKVNSADGNKFIVQVVVDDDYACPGIQPDTAFCASSVQPATLKEVTISVTLDSPSPGWQTAIPAKVILRRTRAN